MVVFTPLLLRARSVRTLTSRSTGRRSDSASLALIYRQRRRLPQTLGCARTVEPSGWLFSYATGRIAPLPDVKIRATKSAATRVKRKTKEPVSRFTRVATLC